ncbi:hypothetical protein DUNSADRAFT_13796 [Dunaliella salina]|uniref:Uncharacterized protein n=1 Tax=Dunaliella salina TaxID=3046 RepID=A0ABQ7G8M3_DUNSA|nr:hypothetical protein DUNSADRAFT_13796 [Dunaliella salina]|eukprot:KAF5830965.1 hypothetical protein DUNSADRAFT_13796 [Dunaliella salina]
MSLRQVKSPKGAADGEGSEAGTTPVKSKQSSTFGLPAAADVLATLATLALVGLAYVFHLAIDVKHKLPSDPDMEDDYE